MAKSTPRGWVADKRIPNVAEALLLISRQEDPFEPTAHGVEYSERGTPETPLMADDNPPVGP